MMVNRKILTQAYLRRLSESTCFGTKRHKEILKEEDELAEIFSINFIDEPLTPAVKHYLSLTSLPFILGARPSIEMEALWFHHLKQMWPISWEGGMTRHEKHVYAEMPVGNMQPKYMFISDAPPNPRYIRHFRRISTTGKTNMYFREILLNLDIVHLSWFTSLSKVPLSATKERFDDLVASQQHWLKNEINLLQPQQVVLLGKRVSMYFPFETPTTTIYHPRYPLASKHSKEWYLMHVKENLL